MAVSKISQDRLRIEDIVKISNNSNTVMNNVDLNSITTAGIYIVTNITDNNPSSANRGKLFVIETDPNGNSGYLTQIFLPPYGKMYSRYRTYSSPNWSWSGWATVN